MFLSENLAQNIHQEYLKLLNEGQLTAPDSIQHYYYTFRNRFGPDTIRSLDGKELLETLHDHANRNSLVYWLEFKNDGEFPAIFGSIAGGSTLNGNWAYLSCVKDGATRQILAHYLSSTLEMTIVQRTVDRLLERLDGNIHPEAILHSDQGMHYTHPSFLDRLKKAGFKQSMSAGGTAGTMPQWRRSSVI